MTGAELKALRQRAGMSWTQFARALGYEGSDDNERRRIRRLELRHHDAVPEDVALRAHAVELDLAVSDLRRRMAFHTGNRYAR